MGKYFNRINNVSIIMATIVITIAIILSWLTVEMTRIQTAEVKSVFNYSSSKIENSFSDTIRHTEYVMRMLNNQIVQNPHDLNYLDNVISKFKIDPTIEGALPWTVFSWADENHRILVDGTFGIIKKPPDLSKRDYMPLTIIQPSTLHMGKPVMGVPSNKWVVPGGVGYVDERGKYLGATTIGFDLNLMAREIKSKINNDKIKFIIADKNGHLLINSEKPVQGPEQDDGPGLPLRVDYYIKHHESAPSYDIDITGTRDSTYIKSLRDYPYVIYVKYDAHSVREIFLNNLISRIAEILFVSVVAMVIAYLIYRKEKNLRRASDKLREAALLQSKAKNEFLAYTGHELRSPLNGIMFGSEMIMKKIFGDIHPKYLEYVQEMHQNGQDLLHFIEDLIDATRAEDGNFSLNKEMVDIEESIKRVIHLNSARALQSGIKIEPYIEKGMPQLYADPKRLRQILNNLISNSIKYSAYGTHIKIVAHSIDGLTQIVIEDEGFGMTEEELQVALSKYGTVDNENSGKVESIGLGLPLVKNLVEAHGAKFHIESKKGAGTTVTISFQAYRNEEANDMTIKKVEADHQ